MIRTMPVTREACRSGDLAEIPLPDLLYGLHRFRLTGTLRLHPPSVGEPDRLTVLDGGIEWLRSARVVLPLGQFLYELGTISREQYEESVARMRSEGRRQGGILIEMGALDRERLKQALRLQLRTKMIRLFGFYSGRYEFLPADESAGRVTAWAGIDLPGLLLAGIRASTGPECVARVSAELARSQVRLRQQSETAVETIHFCEPERALLDLLRRGTTFEAGAVAGGLSWCVTVRLLNALGALEIIALGVAPETGRPGERPDEPSPADPSGILECRFLDGLRDDFSGVFVPDVSDLLLSPDQRLLRDEIAAAWEALRHGNPLELLGAKTWSTPEEIEAALRQKLLRLAPERVAGTPLEGFVPVCRFLAGELPKHAAVLTDGQRRARFMPLLHDPHIKGNLRLARRKRDALVLYVEAGGLLATGDTEEAIGRLTGAIVVWPHERDIYLRFGFACFRRFRETDDRRWLEMAAGVVQKGIATIGNHPELCRAAGRYLELLGQKEEAERILSRSWKDDRPDRP